MSDAKAAEYVAQAQKALKKTSFFSFSAGTQKYEDASDLFEKGGNQFKIAKKCTFFRSRCCHNVRRWCWC